MRRKARLLRTLAVLALLVGVWVVGGARSADAQAAPLSVIEEALAAVNAADVDTFMALWADDGVWETDACFAVFGPAGCVGKEAIRAISTAFIEDSFSWTTNLAVSGNTVTGLAEGRWGALAELNIERVLFDTTFYVVDGKITLIRFVTDLSDPDSVKWQTAFYTSVGVQPPNSGNAGLAATGGGLPMWPWQLVLGGVALVLVVSARTLAGRRARAYQHPVR